MCSLNIRSIWFNKEKHSVIKYSLYIPNNTVREVKVGSLESSEK